MRLVMLANDVSLRNLIPAELAKSFGFFQSKPAGSFSPVAVTPDELGAAWTGGRLHGPMVVDLNDRPFGRADAGVDMTFGFDALIAHAAKTRALVAGSIVGSGTVSNRGEDGGPGKPIAEGGAGYSCLAELRTVETLASGAACDAVPEGRRHGADRDARRRPPLDLRRHRTDGGGDIMSDTAAKVAWVTGASSGIGEALARALVAEGWSVILSGATRRRPARGRRSRRRRDPDPAVRGDRLRGSVWRRGKRDRLARAH